MLTPRHQAVLATLAGMTVGVAVFGSVLAINRSTDLSAGPGAVRSKPTISRPTPGPPTPGPPTLGTPVRGPAALQADTLRFVPQRFGSERAGISVDVPQGWQSSQSGSRPRYLEPDGTWQLRFDARGSKQSPERLVAARAGSIDEQELRIISRTGGTLVYTYVDAARGPRMGLSRWIAADDGEGTAIEITVGGRPQDESGLRAVLDRATETLTLPRP